MGVFHVTKQGNDEYPGTKNKPFLTISKAAQIAVAGDTVVVHEGIYREWVSPQNSGKDNRRRIIFEAAQGEHVVIKGSEVVKGWQRNGRLWMITLPDAFFGTYNPYREVLRGDWLVSPTNPPLHTGEVYLNGIAMYETTTKKDVEEAKEREYGRIISYLNGGKGKGGLLHPEDSVYQWYTEWHDNSTTIYGNFQKYDPNKETVEITVRRFCFFPKDTKRNFITVRGFEMAQVATQWAPPTAFQDGLLGVNWSKGWIIEDNDIHDSKCCGISIGKERSTGDNYSTREKRKPGYQCQLETVFLAKQGGWDRETIGSHIIRNNIIHDCGQAGIVGNLGCAFCLIEENHIYNIGVKREFFGYEIAGIKMHAAIDARVIHNNIHHCALGIWLDWQAQGTRISKNLLFCNDRDLMVEVSHGPYILDNNIFASEYTFDNASQGGAFIHNLMGGAIQMIQTLNRSTPYHFAHSTEVAGYASVYGGDDRAMQNLYCGGKGQYSGQMKYGTWGYDGHPSSLSEYGKELKTYEFGDVDVFMKVKDPVYVKANVYLFGAKGYEKEDGSKKSNQEPDLKILQEEDGYYLEITLPKEFLSVSTEIINTSKFEPPRIVDLPYDDFEGKEISFDADFFGDRRSQRPTVGPIEGLHEGYNKVKVW